MEYKDYYSTLGVPKQASADDIQKAYRKLARKYHPDVNRSAGAEDKFKEITESYEVLKDPEKRQTYDRFGKDWKSFAGDRGAPPPGFENVRFDFGGAGGSGFSSFFDALFGGAGGGGRPFGGAGSGNPFGGAGAGNPFAGGDPFGRSGFGGAGFSSRGQDQEARLVLTLEEAARGGAREISLTDPTTAEVRSYTINLPRGVKAGQKIRLSGRGGAGAGSGSAGDLYLKVELADDARFRLEGLDLYTDLIVSPWEAALGAEATVRTLDGSVKVRVPPGTSTGRKIRLKGKGFPRRGTDEASPNPTGAAGDLYAEIKVAVPDRLSKKERRLFEQLAEVSEFKPRQ